MPKYNHIIVEQFIQKNIDKLRPLAEPPDIRQADNRAFGVMVDSDTYLTWGLDSRAPALNLGRYCRKAMRSHN